LINTAIILAGGKGTRLQSIVSEVPKPMAPINGVPFLEIQINYWIGQGITNFILFRILECIKIIFLIILMSNQESGVFFLLVLLEIVFMKFYFSDFIALL
jgi:hypothetical protein